MPIIEGYLEDKFPRKRKYEPWMCEKIIEVAQKGGKVAAMCKAIGLYSRDTFYRWLKEYPDFNTAYEIAKLEGNALADEILLAGATGKVKIDMKALNVLLRTYHKKEYDLEDSKSRSTTEINIGSINSIEHLDPKSLDSKIKKLQQKLNLIEGEATCIEDTTKSSKKDQVLAEQKPQNSDG